MAAFDLEQVLNHYGNLTKLDRAIQQVAQPVVEQWLRGAEFACVVNCGDSTHAIAALDAEGLSLVTIDAGNSMVSRTLFGHLEGGTLTENWKIVGDSTHRNSLKADATFAHPSLPGESITIDRVVVTTDEVDVLVGALSRYSGIAAD